MNPDGTKHLPTFSKTQYIERMKITEYECQKRYKNGELKRLGSGKNTLYTPTKKHASVIFEDLKADLAQDKLCVTRCDGHCKDREKKCKDDGYAAIDKVDLVVERRKNLFQRIFSR